MLKGALSRPKASMRQLILIRHAKSDRDAFRGPDADRPLAPRGERDAPDMARRLAGRLEALDALYSSPARRARDTAGHFAAAFGLAEADIRLQEGLYTFSAYGLMEALRELDDAAERIAVCGHNMAISDVAAHLSGEDLGSLPTCAVVRLHVQTEAWRELAPDACALLEVDTPKRPA